MSPERIPTLVGEEYDPNKIGGGRGIRSILNISSLPEVLASSVIPMNNNLNLDFLYSYPWVNPIGLTVLAGAILWIRLWNPWNVLGGRGFESPIHKFWREKVIRK